MSSAGKRTRFTYDTQRAIGHKVSISEWVEAKGKIGLPNRTVQTGVQMTESESHARSRDGSYRAGGPFYTSRVTDVFKPGHVDSASAIFPTHWDVYSGPVYGSAPSEAEMKEIGYKNISRKFGDRNESQMKTDGTNAISYSNPINPASNLGTSLAEAFREGVPTLPGIQSWKQRTNVLKGLGSEYLNYQFGWAPLKEEVSSVVGAARKHRDLLQQYHRGEGSDTHRMFEYPLQRTVTSLPTQTLSFVSGPGWSSTDPKGTRQVSLVRETKRWFEGCFTYGLPSSTDSWRQALGFGSDADQLFGIALSPDVLWELTPWSWAVDWFSNAGEVINNVTNFGLAGLVMRYGYMMEESIERVVAEGNLPEQTVYYNLKSNGTWSEKQSGPLGSYVNGTESVTKRRVPASPFGFSIGWEGLSPTQLAITAALGITRLL